jgi:hypothetical protein
LSAAEALNKAALIASDCGLVDLAQQLCWRQFDIFQAATPLTARTAKPALQTCFHTSFAGQAWRMPMGCLGRHHRVVGTQARDDAG